MKLSKSDDIGFSFPSSLGPSNMLHCCLQKSMIFLDIRVGIVRTRKIIAQKSKWAPCTPFFRVVAHHLTPLLFHLQNQTFLEKDKDKLFNLLPLNLLDSNPISTPDRGERERESYAYRFKCLYILLSEEKLRKKETITPKSHINIYWSWSSTVLKLETWKSKPLRESPNGWTKPGTDALRKLVRYNNNKHLLVSPAFLSLFVIMQSNPSSSCSIVYLYEKARTRTHTHTILIFFQFLLKQISAPLSFPPIQRNFPFDSLSDGSFWFLPDFLII